VGGPASSSTMLFHSWQESQRPCQRLVIAPQFWQTKVERDLAMARPVGQAPSRTPHSRSTTRKAPACRALFKTSPSLSRLRKPIHDQRIVEGSGHRDEAAIRADQRGERQFAAPALVRFEIQPLDEIVGEAVLDEVGKPRFVDAAFRAGAVVVVIGIHEDDVERLSFGRDFRPVLQFRETGRTSHRPEMHNERTPNMLLAQFRKRASPIGFEPCLSGLLTKHREAGSLSTIDNRRPSCVDAMLIF